MKQKDGTGKFIGKPKIQKECLQCSKSFLTFQSKIHSFCSRQCRYDSMKTMPNIKICQLCNKEYEAEKRLNRVSNYCSRRCSAISNPIFMKHQPTVEKISNLCKCGNKFESYKSENRIFCSLECYHRSLLVEPSQRLGLPQKDRTALYRKRHREKFYDKCGDCGTEKSVTSDRCIKCAGIANRGENNPRWKEGSHLIATRNRYLKLISMENHTTEEWEALKKKFNYMCLCCKQQEPFIKLSKDHIIPLSRGGDDLISNIQPLCKSCNSRKHTEIINFIELSEQVMTGEIL